jgi:hypothetical protein
MIQKVKGYRYYDSESASYDIEMLDAFYGIPVSEESVTRNWCEYEIANLNNPVFYFIRYDKSMLEILGDPDEFDVVFSGPNLLAS